MPKESPYRGPRFDTPVMLWPFRMDPVGRIPFVEQDTPREVAQCVAFTLSTEPGELITTPALGLSDPTFFINGVSENDIVTVVNKWEPRAKLLFLENQLVRIAQTVGIGVR